ncbi:restriction endonuclease [Tardiphaga sp. 813_E8_N1_3]|uniref:restriction endonuclease n=1 Tax=Tardiphaga sp. 813_E8_N1_3 TaxID=3240760 RepID=UPI003F29DBCB
MFGTVREGIRKWLVGVFASAIRHSTRADDRALAVQWLGQSRDIIASDLHSVDKFRKLNELINSRTAIKAVAGSVSEAVANYRKSNLPLSLKIALPATLAALPLVGGQGAGIAAFGGALGVPVLLLIFLGAAGITSIIEAVVTNPEARPHIADIIDIIIKDERLRRTSAEMKAAMKQQPADPVRYPMPERDLELRQDLLEMDPFKFEQHTMSFFLNSGLEAWTTKATNDFGADGYAIHNDGLIVVQCKRNASENKVGSPSVQQFKGVIEEQGAFRGYIVTTSTFTENAKLSAGMSGKISLIDMDALVEWHNVAPIFD